MKHAISHAAWLLLSHVGRIGCQLLGVSIIARLLSPTDFGVIAIALTVSNLAGLLRDLGTGPAAIRSADSSDAFYGAIYSIQLVISIVLVLGMMLLAPVLADFYTAESLQRVMVLLSLVFPITALGSVHLITLEKAQRYRAISLIELVSYGLGLAVAVLLASWGIGVESLALQAIVNTAVQTMLLRRVAATKLRPRHPRHARSAAGGSAAVSSFHFFNYLVRNSDTAVAGKLASTDFVGNYSMATRIAQMPPQAIGMLLSRISIPLLSRNPATEPELTRQIGSLIDFAVFASIGTCLVLASFRDLITATLFGKQWMTTVPWQLCWLLPAAGLTSVFNVVVGVMTALGAGSQLTRIGAYTGLAHALTLAACFCVDARLLPQAGLASSIAALFIAGASLRGLLRNRNIRPFNTLQATLLGSAMLYPFAQILLHGNAGGTRTPAFEAVEAATLVALLTLAAALRWRQFLGSGRVGTDIHRNPS